MAMRAGWTICLCLGMWCSLAFAQDRLLAAAPSDSTFFLPTPDTAAASAPQPVHAIDLVDPLLVTGMTANPSIYQAAVPQGPDTVCTEVALAAALPDSAYAFDHQQFTSAALKAAFTHDNLVKMAHYFVPGQPLPDAPGYVPLTTRQKFELFLINSHSLSTGVSILSDALVSQATGAYPRLDGGMAGFGQRLGVTAAGTEAATFIGGFVYPTIFHQDPRYFRSRQSSIANRLAYAASRVFIGRSDAGRSVINTSVIASQFTEAAISNAYVPYRNESVSGTIENALTGLGGVAEGDILNEFWPDIMEFVFRHTHNSLIRKGMNLGAPPYQQSAGQ
jgi:hypothetical protein